MAGNGEAADTKTLDAIMAETWNETMGEDRDELPVGTEYLEDPSDEEDNVDTQDESSLSPEDAEDEPEVTEDDDTPLEEEPVDESASAEEDDPRSGSEDVQEAPEHWSQQDREMFAKLDDEAREFLLRRHKQMEGDYTRKTQENAEAIKVGRLLNEAVDPAIKSDLARMGIDGESYVRQMIDWHHKSVRDPAGFARAMMQQLKLDPAQVFNVKPGEAPKPADPTTQRLEAVEQHLSQEQQNRYQKAVEETQKRVNDFANEKDESGNVLRPHFNQVRKVMAQFIQVDPNMPLQDAYEAAVYRDPELRKTLMPETPAPKPIEDRAVRTKKALRAKNANIKGRHGSHINKQKDNAPMSLQDAMNAAANEVGLE